MKAEYVYGIDEIPIGSDEHKVGVVLSYNKEEDQMHCGLSYDVGGPDDAKVLHFGFQNLLKKDMNFGDFLIWVKPNIPALQLDAFSAWCEVVWNRFNDGGVEIAYGLKYDEYAQIQPDGVLVLGDKNTGVTCATFILTLFHMCGFDLIDLNSWTIRQEDISWQRKIGEMFMKLAPWTKEKYRVSDEQQQQPKKDIGSKRYSPEDVAVSSALFDTIPATCQQIQEASTQIREYIIEIS